MYEQYATVISTNEVKPYLKLCDIGNNKAVSNIGFIPVFGYLDL